MAKTDAAFSCDFPGCGKSFKSRRALASHKLIVHPARKETPLPGEEVGNVATSTHTAGDDFSFATSNDLLLQKITELTEQVRLAQQEAANASAKAQVAAAEAAKAHVEKLATQMPNMINLIVKQNIDQTMAEVVGMLKPQGPAGANNGQPAQGGGADKLAQMERIAGIAAALGIGAKPAAPMTNFAELKTMFEALASINTIFQEPYFRGMETMAKMQSWAVKAGASPEKAAAAGEEIASAARPKTAETKPAEGK